MTSLESERTAIEDLVARAGEDWVYAGEVLYIAQEGGVEDLELRRDAAIGLIARAMWMGLVLPGEPGGSGFQPWTSSLAESIWRITDEWNSRPVPHAGPGEIVWLCLTAKGQEMATKIWRREGTV